MQKSCETLSAAKRFTRGMLHFISQWKWNKPLKAVFPNGEASTIIIKSRMFLDKGNVEGEGQRQGSQWRVLPMMYIYIKFERLIINSSSIMIMDLHVHVNAKLNLTLKHEMLNMLSQSSLKRSKTRVAMVSLPYDHIHTCKIWKTHHFKIVLPRWT